MLSYKPETVLMLLVMFGLAGHPAIRAQQTSRPSLHQRSDPDEGNTGEQNQRGPANQKASTLPTDVSGPYNFDHINESIEIDIDRNRLSGYISRLGDAETDTNTPLTFFFDRSSVDGSQIEFQTRVVHGLWYSFRGTILRGEGKTRADEGYYVLHGMLEEHHPQDPRNKSADETIEQRRVNFKSMGQ